MPDFQDVSTMAWLKKFSPLQTNGDVEGPIPKSHYFMDSADWKNELYISEF